MGAAADYLLQLLVDKGRCSAAAVAEAEAAARLAGSPDAAAGALAALVAGGVATADDLVNLLAAEFDMETVDLAAVSADSRALALVDRATCERLSLVPFDLEGKTLLVALSDPLDPDPVDQLARSLGLTVESRLASPEAIAQAVTAWYSGDRSAQASGGVANEQVRSVLADLREEAGDAIVLPVSDLDASDPNEGPIIRYVHKVISEALRRRASDIHLEPLEKRFRVRYRIDGVMQEVENPPKRLQPSILSRLKLMANISIAEKRVPQDGRIQLKVGRKEIDLRVSSLPTAFGESIVMRILDQEGLRLGLPELGFFADDQAIWERLIGLPDGLLLVTGPTGSGKSTTLYSCLHYLNQPDRKIITVEDPVEYQMTGINQVQVRREIGMDFASALRAMLRQAPNVIMVGEIRDGETADIAINASLTGHLVFSTLHTNDAPSAVTRLIDIGVKPFLVAAALRGAMAQRLVRLVCRECARPYDPAPMELRAINLTETQRSAAKFQHGAGCPHCHGRGYRGRAGLFEIFPIVEEVQQMIYGHASLVELRRRSRELGMRTMREDGVRKVLAGVTTIEEVVSTTLADM